MAKKPSKGFNARQWGIGGNPSKQAPPDPHQRILVCTVIGQSPRWAAKDLSFAIWPAIWEVPGEEVPRQITIKGALGRVNPNEMLSCTGRWKSHEQHGWSFEVESYQSALPQTKDGIAQWIQTRVDGVGPTYAKAIVEHFGVDKVFDVLDQDPSALRDVRTSKGRAIPDKQLERAIEAWDDGKEIRQIESFLFSHGVTANMADKLYKFYGPEVIEILQTNPYQITRMSGVGFKLADKIAQGMGVPLDAPERLKAGIMFVLSQAEGEGHAFLTLQQLLSYCNESLGQQEAKVLVEQATELAAQGRIVAEADEFVQQRVYSKKMYEIECRLARIFRHMLAIPSYPLISEQDQPKAPDGATEEEVAALRLPSDDQWSVVDTVRQHRLAILTGGPGAGKTFSQKILVDILNQEGKIVKLAAPTGKAAMRMEELTGGEASTIHKLLEWSPAELAFSRDETNPIEADCLIVDEASMLSLEIADSLFRAIGDNTHVLLVGDPDQLPPVGVGKVLDDLLRSEAVPLVKLDKVFRQAAKSMIIQNSRRINGGKMPYLKKEEAESDLHHNMLNDFYWVNRSTPQETFDLVIDFACNRIPRAFHMNPVEDIMVLAPMKKGVVGLDNINIELEKRLNAEPKKIVLPNRNIAVGSRVVQTKNDYTTGREVMNGEIGIVVAYDEVSDSCEISFDKGSKIINVPVPDMDSYYLAWAMSVHKAQGSEFKAVVTPVSTAHYTMLSRALTYTAITRASELCVMVGETKALSMAIGKVDMKKRNSSLRSRILQPAMSGELF